MYFSPSAEPDQPRHPLSWITGPISKRQRAHAESAADRSPSLVDKVFDRWVCWREACEDARNAYEHWGNCESSQRGLAFASYRAALDREDHAARVYSVWTDRLRAAERWR
jgi:hypothetical protein